MYNTLHGVCGRMHTMDKLANHFDIMEVVPKKFHDRITVNGTLMSQLDGTKSIRSLSSKDAVKVKRRKSSKTSHNVLKKTQTNRRMES